MDTKNKGTDCLPKMTFATINKSSQTDHCRRKDNTYQKILMFTLANTAVSSPKRRRAANKKLHQNCGIHPLRVLALIACIDGDLLLEHPSNMYSSTILHSTCIASSRRESTPNPAWSLLFLCVFFSSKAFFITPCAPASIPPPNRFYQLAFLTPGRLPARALTRKLYCVLHQLGVIEGWLPISPFP